MTTTRTCPWRDKRGKTYSHEIFPIGSDFPSFPGNYILAREDLTGWVALYIGHTQDLRSRLRQLALHEGHVCAIRRGVTHVHIFFGYDGEQAMQRIESDLVERYRPACNRISRGKRSADP